MREFKAAVQYGDLKGSIAADTADQITPSRWLSDNGHIGDGECLIGISMFAGENHGHHRDPVMVTFLVSTLNGHANVPEMIQSSTEPMKVKEINIDMNIADFFALFKRLEITLSTSGLIENKTYEAIE